MIYFIAILGYIWIASIANGILNGYYKTFEPTKINPYTNYTYAEWDSWEVDRSFFTGLLAIIWPGTLLHFLFMWPIENISRLSANKFLTYKAQLAAKQEELKRLDAQLVALRHEAEQELRITQ